MDQERHPLWPLKLLKGSVALLKISATAVLAFVLGVWLISFGDQQSIVTGCGAIAVGTTIVIFVGYCLLRKEEAPGAAPDYRLRRSKAWKVVWLGVVFGLAPGLIYLYFCATMDRIDPMAVMFLAVPLEIAGVGMIVLGLSTIMRH
jgi:hypothetical protein